MGRLGPAGWHADQVEDLQIFGVGATDAMDRAQPADAISGAQRGHAANPRIGCTI
jgi:uncharacterized caspase-like protein